MRYLVALAVSLSAAVAHRIRFGHRGVIKAKHVCWPDCTAAACWVSPTPDDSWTS